MSQQQQNKPKRINILNIRTIDTKKGKKSVVQFNKDVTVTYKGQEVDLGQYGTVFLKKSDELINDLNFLLDKGYINEDAYNQRADYIEQKQVTAGAEAPLK